MATKLPDRYEAVLDELGWGYSYYSEDGVAIENWSPAGENICIDTTVEDFAADIEGEWEAFDVDDHVELWVDHRGKNGVPERIRDLIDDAEEIEKMLEALQLAIREA